MNKKIIVWYYFLLIRLGRTPQNRVQLTTDGHGPYLTAVDSAFGEAIDYAMLVKIYGEPVEGQKRYSPAERLGCERKTITGNPDPKHISTSFAERQNLSMRIWTRGFTALIKAFSRKLENHAAAVALCFTWYHFGLAHQTLKATPAMAAGVADHFWSVEEIIGLLVAVEPKATRPAKMSVSN